MKQNERVWKRFLDSWKAVDQLDGIFTRNSTFLRREESYLDHCVGKESFATFFVLQLHVAACKRHPKQTWKQGFQSKQKHEPEPRDR